MLRKTLAYSLCCLTATPPLWVASPVWAQQRPAAATQPTAPAAAPPMTGVTLDAAQSADAARLVIQWPSGSTLSATATLSQGLLVVRLPRALDVDPAVFASKAPEFIAAATISSDKRTLRIALLGTVTLANGRDGAVQALDLLRDPTKPPAPVTAADPLAIGGQAALPDPGAASAAAANPTPAPQSAALRPLRNAPAPQSAPRVSIEASGSRDFTRLRLSGPPLSEPQFFRQGDRMAFTLPGTLALDIGSLRANPPRRVRDVVRFYSPTHSSIVMDVEADAVVRHRMDGDDLLIDILAAGTATDPLAALAEEAAAAPAAQAKAATPTPTAPAPTGPTDGAPTAPSPALTSQLAGVTAGARLSNGKVSVTSRP
jgi:hypothetical protein